MPQNLITRITPALRAYVESHILPQYAQNDPGHQIDHINYVIRRSLNFASTLPDVNFDIVYVVAAYHDLGHHVDAFHHEQISAQMAREDTTLREFFTPAEIKIIAEAIEDHRSHLDRPRRSIYGKIVASADCNVNIDVMLRRTYAYRLRNFPAMSLEDTIEESRQHLSRKYGKQGYARSKISFPDPEFDQALQKLANLVSDPAAFRKRYLKVNKK